MDLKELLAQSLSFEFLCGGVTPVRQPFTTGWRVLPGMMCSYFPSGRDLLRFTDRPAVRVRPGQLIVVPAGLRHRLDLATPRGQTHWVHANFFIFNRLDLFSLLEPPVLVPGPLAGRVGEAIRSMVLDQNSPHGQDRLWMAARYQEFGFQLLRLLLPLCTLRPESVAKLDERRRLQPVLDNLRQNFAAPIDRDSLARLAGLSPAQFHRVFKAATGSSPISYLRGMRMRQAQQLLISTRQPVKQVAQDCGYEDLFIFSKCFKRACGSSPLEYRHLTNELRAPSPAS